MNDRDPQAVVPDGGAESADIAVSRGRDRVEGTVPDPERRTVESMADANQELLVEVVRRGPVLQALGAGSASGAELARSVDLSRSTVHRATNSLEEHDLVVKSNGRYELTSLGRVVTEQVTTFGGELRTAMALEPFLNTIDMADIPTDRFVEAHITRPTPRQPHTSIQRIIEFIERSDSLRMLSTVLSPLYVDVGYREMRDGTEIEAVFDREAIDIMVSQFTREAYETIETGNFTVYAHHGLPFELFIRDGKMGMAAHDDDGVARVFVECDTPAAVDWAEELYEEHRSEGVPLLLSDLR